MSTVDSVFLIITAVSISLFFILLSAVSIFVLVICRKLNKTADAAISGVEAATHIIKEAGTSKGLKAIIKIIRSLMSASKKD